MKEFNLYKTLIILTIIFVTIALIGTLDLSVFDSEQIKHDLMLQLELKNWHYVLLLVSIWFRGK